MAEEKIPVNLSADFAPVSTETWKNKIIADLKGADFDKKLVWRTPEGFNVQPFYRREDLKGLKTTASAPGQFPYVRGTRTNNEWDIRQNICACENARKANAKALEVLNKGINSLGFCLSKEKLNYHFIKVLLQDIRIDVIPVNFTVCACKAPELANILVRYIGREYKGVDIKLFRGSINVDPIKAMLIKGKSLSREQVSEKIAAVVKAAKSLPGYRVVGVNSVVLNNSGAYATQELAYALAWGAEYMTMLTEAGIPNYRAANAIRFNMGIGGNYFMEIAKFRAGRLLWAKIVEAYKSPIFTTALKNAAKMNVSAETSKFNMTIFDAYVNLLRSQTETMSAALAGVDEITVTPFDVTYERPTDFAERIARNQQLLLKEEAHFDKIVDPAAGSYYLENLTASIAAEAWKQFLGIQEQGGMYQLVSEGKVQEHIATNLKARLQDVARRKEVLLGSNQFPNFTEIAGKKIKADAGACSSICNCKSRKSEDAGKSGSCGCGSSCENALPTLPVARAAEEFETLRLQTEASKKQPVAFMLTIGNLAMRIARAQFSCNFLACAGYKVIDNNGFKTVREGIKAAKKAKADIIVLCSSDDEYATFAPEAWKVLQKEAEKAQSTGKQTKQPIFIVAGAPACMEDLQALGIENFIHVRCNVLETLKKFNQQLLTK
ncbi:MAG: methylmalonyl-CoA mutase small subunit [Paludibacteraceae bacterium]|nr:methylmalonyl-CoA mutase small subunit [Paludibacteraceae bacterium]